VISYRGRLDVISASRLWVCQRTVASGRIRSSGNRRDSRATLELSCVDRVDARATGSAAILSNGLGFRNRRTRLPGIFWKARPHLSLPCQSGGTCQVWWKWSVLNRASVPGVSEMTG
jgi:hypothetical protein